MKVTILRVDGSSEERLLPRHGVFTAIKTLINASMLDGVSLRAGRVMFVDDNGYETETVDHGNGRVELKPVRPRKSVNPEATKLYHSVCRPGTTHQIVGDVAIVNDRDFEDEHS